MSKSLRKRRERVRRARRRNAIIVTVCGVTLLACACGAAYGLYSYLKGPEPWPRIDTLQASSIGENSIIYSSDGRKMGVIETDENRTIIGLDKMGVWAPQAAIAIEDRRFLSHDGVDPKAVVRAMFRNAEAGETREGASSITQQVVRNIYAEITTEKSLSRKAKEATLALELEDKWKAKYGSKQKAKNKILETYLNVIFFGHYAYGIEAASQTYFSKPAKRLTLPEAALLAGLPQKPSEYDPFNNPKEAVARRNDVLKAMYGEEMISKRQYEEAVKTPIKLKAGQIYKYRRLPYFFDFVRSEMIRQYGAHQVRQGGLRIHTTIDPKLQRLAETSIRSTLTDPNGPQGAMVVLDTRTGAIKAMASSERYEKTQFDRASQARRQPGSTAKIWVLAAFMKEKVNPDTTSYTSRPFKVRYIGTTEWWSPKTYDNHYSGSRSIRSATVASDNSVYAQMTLDVGPEKVAKTAHELGIKSPLQKVWSIGLGSQVVTPLEQTNFYSTIARGGVRKDPIAVSSIETAGGGQLPLKRSKSKRVLADWQAWKIVDVLQDNMTGGTGTGAHILGEDDAGKTGTTDDHKDAWFCGMTPELTACVWMGYNIPTPMPGVAGGTYPATMWHKFMSEALPLVRSREWFEVTGTEAWLPWTSTWMDNPGFEVQAGADPNAQPAKEDDKDEDTDTKPAATTPAPDTGGATTPAPGGGTGGGGGTTPDPGGGAGGGGGTTPDPGGGAGGGGGTTPTP